MFMIALYALLMVFQMGWSDVIEQPTSVIEGQDSGINHPEGIAFSPSGDLLAVTNGLSNTITFYRKESSGVYGSTPVFTLNSPHLNYPHDLSFTPDGAHLACANAKGNLVTIFKKNLTSDFYDAVPILLIQSDKKQLKNANAAKYSPVENILAVANVIEHTIALYHYTEDSYEKQPYQIITGSRDLIKRPDGLAFSADGMLLAVTSHERHSVLIYERLPGNEGRFSTQPVEILKGNEANIYFPHSLAFHESNDLVVSNASGKKTLNVFKRVSDQVPRYASIPMQTLEIYNPENVHLQKQHPEEGGVKGVAFTPDGNFLGICAGDIVHQDRKVLILPFLSD